jgi:hypothetical protein
LPNVQCKPAADASRATRRKSVRGLLLLALSGAALLSACGTYTRARVVSVPALEAASPIEPSRVRRAIVSDTSQIRTLYCPLGQRLGLVRIRSTEEWELLRRCAPELGPAPDFKEGIVVGLASHAGLPLDGTWPIHVQSARIRDGAGLATGRFVGGSFLPDGTTYLETAQFNGLASVLIVEVNGTRFYPD